MAIYAKATKTSLTKFLRSKGFDVPSIYSVDFRPAKYSFWMDWNDGDGAFHSCWYSMVGGAPYCTVDGESVKVTLAEMMQYGLYREDKKKAPACAGTQTKA